MLRTISRPVTVVLLATAVGFTLTAWALAQQPPIDMQRARQLHQRVTAGEKLSPEDQAYYDRARQERARQGGGRPTGKGQPQGQKPGNVPPATSSTGLVPLTELGTNTYKGEDGGLYGGGKNEPPAEFADAVKKVVGKIQPLDAQGKPSSDGKIVLLSIGMSNTTQEFSAFKEKADADAKKSSSVVVVDGAQGGKVASEWALAGTDAKGAGTRQNPWPVMFDRLKKSGVTPAQVQAVWLKHAQAMPAMQGEFPKHAKELAENITLTVQRLHQEFPNLRVVYLSNRIYAGYATTALNPEPYAYEGSFANRWVILNQIKGDPRLNFDPDQGTVMAPAVVWGPYLWADGMKPRSGDNLIWTRADLRDNDGTHPSDSGREKVANLLLDFMHTNPLARTWYLAKP